MSDQRTVVSSVAEDYLSADSLKEFIDTAFIEVLVQAGKSPSQTQARATLTGEAFEYCVLEILEEFYPTLDVRRSVSLSEACMTGSGGADFAIYQDEELIAVIEAKGSADKLEWPDGTVQEPNRPGLQRSDSVKKAICQAYQVSRAYDDVLFFIITSHPPENGSKACVMNLAVGDIIDDVIVAHNKNDLDRMVKQIRELSA